MESLYRKYRPQTFSDVVGQQHVVGTLQRAVVEGRTSHAYLFCGPRGTGKTTMARLLAKSLMCEKGPRSLPDGTCEQCQLIARGAHEDVYELDAASRTGVDNVREEIINRVEYAPVRGRYKVYIIDEVHMLTTAAFNALLKTLEEPPDHVVFVLCTTDPQKIPATILSRVQRFDFRPIGYDDIRGRLAYVCGAEGFEYDEQALDLIVRHARGGMRDALSTLEQLSVFGAGTISTEAAQDLLGSVPGVEMNHVVEALAARDVAMLFLQVGEMVESGRDPLQFTRDLAAHMRDVYVAMVVGARPEVLDASVDLERLKVEAQAFGSPDRVSRLIAILGDAIREMATAPNQRLVLEIAFTRMARPQEDLTLESLAERLAEVEQRLNAGGAPVAQTAPQPASQPPAQSDPQRTPQPVAQPSPQPAPAPQRAPQPAPQPAPVAQPAPRPYQPMPDSQHAGAVTDNGELHRRWRQVVSSVVASYPSRGSLLSNAVPTLDDGTTITVSLPKGSSFALKMLERREIREVVNNAVEDYFGIRNVVYVEGMGAKPTFQAASAPQRTPRPAPRPVAPQQSAPPAPVEESYPMPWDERGANAYEPAPSERVPYEEESFQSYDAPAYEEQMAPPPAPAPAPEPLAPPAPAPAPAPAPEPEPAPAPEPEPMPDIPDDLPDDLAAILANAFEVFGKDVRVSKD